MAVLPILRWPDPRLKQPCAPVTGDVHALIDDMLETMYAAPGRGLAAPQVGVLWRLFVMDTTWKEGASDPQVFVNPRITDRSDTLATAAEGCLSIPGVLVDVTRPAEITVTWQDAHGAAHRQVFSGFAAACVQHEIDHLDGIVTFDRLAPDARQEAEAQFATVPR